MKRIIYSIIIIALTAAVGFVLRARVNREQTQSQISHGKISVTASFYPLYYFASQIGGELANVVNITPPGAEPHDYEPTPQDIARIQQSKLLLLNGAGFEPWGGKIKSNLDPRLTKVVEAVAEITLQSPPAGAGEESEYDPHVWLDPIMAAAEVRDILQGFIAVDAQNEQVYKDNADHLIQRLVVLDEKFRQGLQSCRQTSFVTSHAAFGYLAREYGLTQVPLTGLSPDAEPSAQEIAQIAKFAKARNIKYIFFESLSSPKLSEVIAQEIGAQTLVLNPIEGLTDAEVAAGGDYFTLMIQNLNNLQLALECQ